MRVSYIVHDNGGTIWYIGHCDSRYIPAPPKGLNFDLVAITTKGKIQSLGGPNLFVSRKEEEGFTVLAKDNTLVLHEKKDIKLSVSNRSFTAGSETGIVVTHNAPIPIRLWRDDFYPIHNPDHNMGHVPPSGVKFTASIPGYYKIMIRHPRYKAKPIVVSAMVSNE